MQTPRALVQSKKTAVFNAPFALRASRLLALIAAVALPSSAGAQPATTPSTPVAAPTASSSADPSDADKETARSLLDQGDAKFAKKDYRGALRDYRYADRLMGVPTTGVEVGKTEAMLGLLVEARDTLLRVARYPDTPDNEAFNRARERARILAIDVAARIPSLRIELSGVGPEVVVQLSVNGQELPPGTEKIPRKLNPGTKLIKATAAGYRPAERQIELKERQHQSVSLTMVPLPKPQQFVEPELSPWAYVGFSVGGAALTVGTITGILSLSAASTAKDQCNANNSCPTAAQSDIDEATTLANVSNVGLAVGGAGVVVGVVFVALWLGADPIPVDQAPDGQREPSAAVVVEPLLGPQFVGLRGRF